MERAVGSLPYRFGWFLAIGALGNMINPELFEALRDTLGSPGLVLAGMYSVWCLATGIAAAAVRPWSWYVLLASQLFQLLWGGIYVAFIARGRVVGVMVGVFSVGMSLICFVYFYKRRSLFRARWRWQWLERSWPGLVGPESISSEVRPGFIGLPPLRQALFVVATATWAAVLLILRS